MENKDEGILFYECQRITQWYVYLPLIVLQIILIFISIQKPEINYVDVLIPSGIVLSIALLFLSYKMTTTMTKSHIIIKMSWFGIKKIPLKAVKCFVLGKYSFVGYGFRVTTFGRVYNVNGNKGMLLYWNDKKILVGSQKEEELFVVVRNIALKDEVVELSNSTTIQKYLKENK